MQLPDRPGPKAVIFDLYGTLVPSPTVAQYEEFVDGVARRLGVSPEAFLRAYRKDSEARETGRVGSLSLYLIGLAARFKIALEEEPLAELVSFRHASVRRWLVPKPDAVPVLKELSTRRLRLGLISDCSWETAAEWHSLPFREWIPRPVFSVQAGFKKPDRRIYELASEYLGVQPPQCLYVGDGGSNELAGAFAVGMTPVQVGTDEELGPHHDRPGAVPWDGRRINALTDLLASDLLVR